jgi:hypothetical protein
VDLIQDMFDVVPHLPSLKILGEPVLSRVRRRVVSVLGENVQLDEPINPAGLGASVRGEPDFPRCPSLLGGGLRTIR